MVAEPFSRPGGQDARAGIRAEPEPPPRRTNAMHAATHAPNHRQRKPPSPTINRSLMGMNA